MGIRCYEKTQSPKSNPLMSECGFPVTLVMCRISNYSDHAALSVDIVISHCVKTEMLSFILGDESFNPRLTRVSAERH